MECRAKALFNADDRLANECAVCSEGGDACIREAYRSSAEVIEANCPWRIRFTSVSQIRCRPGYKGRLLPDGGGECVSLCPTGFEYISSANTCSAVETTDADHSLYERICGDLPGATWDTVRCVCLEDKFGGEEYSLKAESVSLSIGFDTLKPQNLKTSTNRNTRDNNRNTRKTLEQACTDGGGNWSSRRRTCVTCGSGTKYQASPHSCIPATASCRMGQFWSTDTNRCYWIPGPGTKRRDSEGVCVKPTAPPRPTCSGGRTYNASSRSCECPSGKSWNGSSCVSPPPAPTCTGGRTCNTATRSCECPSGRVWNAVPGCIVKPRPTCSGGKVYNESSQSGECPASRPYLDNNACMGRTGYNQYARWIVICRSSHTAGAEVYNACVRR